MKARDVPAGSLFQTEEGSIYRSLWLGAENEYTGVDYMGGWDAEVTAYILEVELHTRRSYDPKPARKEPSRKDDMETETE